MGSSRYHMSLTYDVYLFSFFCKLPLVKYQINDKRACGIFALVNKKSFPENIENGSIQEKYNNPRNHKLNT